MKRRALGAGAAALGAGALLIAGCDGGGSGFPTGHWKHTDRSGSVTLLDLRPDGTWELYRSASPGYKTNVLTQLTSGLYSSTEETLTFEDDSACEALHYEIEPGTYGWALKGDWLTLTPLNEPCVERRDAIRRLAFSLVSKATGTSIDAHS